MAMNRMPLPFDPFSPFNDQADWRKEMERRRQIDLIRQQQYGGGLPIDVEQIINQIDKAASDKVNAAVDRLDKERAALREAIAGVQSQLTELRMLYDYVYRYHPEVIGEFDVVQRAKERIK